MKNLQQLVERGIALMAGLPGACQTASQATPRPYCQRPVSTRGLTDWRVLSPTPAALAAPAASFLRAINICHDVVARDVMNFRQTVRPIESP